MPETAGTVRGVSQGEIENWFKYHQPTSVQQPRYDALRRAGRALAEEILENTPPGPDQTDAIRKVRESVMTANQAIACDRTT